jgi:hypothetical protein
LFLSKQEERTMRTFAKTTLALGFVAALTVGSAIPAGAFYIDGPGFHVWVGDHHPRYYDYYGGGSGGWNTFNGCPPNWTIQGGVCKPYRGPSGYGW